jgi:hypothetical protein
VGTWTCEESASIAFRTTTALPVGTQIHIAGGTLDPRRQTLTAHINGEPADVRRRRRGRLVVQVPAPVDSDEIVTLDLAVTPVLRAREAGHIDDDRTLGLIVTSIAVGR